MEVVSHGFVSDITKTDDINEERLRALINDAEEPNGRLAALYEPKVLPLEVGAGNDEGGEDGEGGDGNQGL